jgi:hypothetical protein
MAQKEMRGDKEYFSFVDVEGLKIVKIGDFILANSRSGKNNDVWVRRDQSLEGGDFTIDQLNEAFNYLFKKYF